MKRSYPEPLESPCKKGHYWVVKQVPKMGRIQLSDGNNDDDSA